MKNDLPKMPLGLNQGSQQKQKLLNKKNDASSIGEIERLLGTGSVQGPLQFFNIVQDLETCRARRYAETYTHYFCYDVCWGVRCPSQF